MAIALRTSEKKLLEAKLHWAVYVPSALWLGAVLTCLVVAIAMDGKGWSPGTLATMCGVSLVVGVFPLADRWFRQLGTQYVLTDQRIYVERGLLTKSKLDIPLPKINDLELTQNLLQRLFDSGDVRILTGNDSATLLMNLDNPEALRTAISEEISSRRSA